VSRDFESFQPKASRMMLVMYDLSKLRSGISESSGLLQVGRSSFELMVELLVPVVVTSSGGTLAKRPTLLLYHSSIML